MSRNRVSKTGAISYYQLIIEHLSAWYEFHGIKFVLPCMNLDILKVFLASGTLRTPSRA